MSAFPDTYGSFLKVSRTPLAQARRRRERVASMLVRIGAAVVLAALLVIPAFLASSLLPWTALPPGAWSGLGVLLVGTVKAGLCALLVALPLGMTAALFTARLATPAFRAWCSRARAQLLRRRCGARRIAHD